MPTPPLTINLTPASAPGAPSTITLSPASAPGAPSTIFEGTRVGANVTGTTSPSFNGPLLNAGSSSGKGAWSTDGTLIDPGVGTAFILLWTGAAWALGRSVNGVASGLWTSSQDVLTPDLVTAWTPTGGETGTPVVTLGAAAPGTITLSAASGPGAPSTITLSPASAPSAPSTITLSPASAPSAPDTIPLSAASAPAAPQTITLTAASQPAAPGVITPS